MPATTINVRFATNRNRLAANNPNLFGTVFQSDDPKKYVTGSIDVVKRSILPDTGWVPDPATLAIDPPQAAPTVARAEATVDQANGGTPAFVEDQADSDNPGYGIVLIHGFAASFLDSMRRAAQVAAVYKASNVFCFSWPANGITDVENYKDDRKDAKRSGTAMAGALAQLLAKMESLPRSRRPKLHLVAHSMGNYALRAAVQSIASHTPALIREDVFEGALLMAADEDDDALADAAKLKPLLKLAKRVTIYHAWGDGALGISQHFNSPRLGHHGPVHLSRLPDHVTAVDCSDVASTQNDTGGTHYSHQYYRLSPRVIGDVVQVLAGKRPTSVSGRLGRLDGTDRGRAFFLPFDANAGS